MYYMCVYKITNIWSYYQGCEGDEKHMNIHNSIKIMLNLLDLKSETYTHFLTPGVLIPNSVLFTRYII